MRESVPPRASWTVVDEGWGRRAADFATLSEPYNCREYVVMHHRLGVDHGDRLLDVACGSGLALELASLRGAVCAGIDASPGHWSLAPFALAAAPKVENQAAMVRLGRPGAGEELLARYGFVGIERIDVRFVAEFPDPQIFAR